MGGHAIGLQCMPGPETAGAVCAALTLALLISVDMTASLEAMQEPFPLERRHILDVPFCNQWREGVLTDVPENLIRRIESTRDEVVVWHEKWP